MKSLITPLAIALCLQASNCLATEQSRSLNIQETSPKTATESSEPKSELSETDKRIIRLRIEMIMFKDQQFRDYLAYGTTDDEKISQFDKLSESEQMKWLFAKDKEKLPEETRKLLHQLQRKNDKENLAEFISIVKEFGYPSDKRIGLEQGRVFALLLHPPVDRDEVEAHTREMCKLLLPEVKAGRMEAKTYAVFVDNQRGKILRLPQLYGTNKQFNRATGKILPPIIEDLEASNRARREIGMPELKEGEYRLLKDIPDSQKRKRVRRIQ